MSGAIADSKRPGGIIGAYGDVSLSSGMNKSSLQIQRVVGFAEDPPVVWMNPVLESRIPFANTESKNAAQSFGVCEAIGWC
jgi:hypothetical protein